MTLGKCLTPCGLVTVFIQPIGYLLEVFTINLVLGLDDLVKFRLVRGIRRHPQVCGSKLNGHCQVFCPSWGIFVGIKILRERKYSYGGISNYSIQIKKAVF
jgi:hypothetical protein